MLYYHPLINLNITGVLDPPEFLLQMNYLQNMITALFMTGDASITNIFHNCKFGDTTRKICQLVAQMNTHRATQQKLKTLSQTGRIIDSLAISHVILCHVQRQLGVPDILPNLYQKRNGIDISMDVIYGLMSMFSRCILHTSEPLVFCYVLKWVV